MKIAICRELEVHGPDLAVLLEVEHGRPSGGALPPLRVRPQDWPRSLRSTG